MSATETSPLKELALLWRGSARPSSQSEINAARARLFTAAVHEITFKSSINIPFDPLNCHLFRWCGQWLDVHEGTRRFIDPDLELICRLTLDPIPLHRKMLAGADLS